MIEKTNKQLKILFRKLKKYPRMKKQNSNRDTIIDIVNIIKIFVFI